MSESTVPTPDELAFEDLRTGVRGELFRPSDAGYDEVRAVQNGMIDNRPALIARCIDVADVITAVDFLGGLLKTLDNERRNHVVRC